MDQVGVSPGGGHTFEAVQTVTFTPLAVRSVTGDENLIVKFKGGVGRAVLGVAIGGPLTGGIGDVVGVFVGAPTSGLADGADVSIHVVVVALTARPVWGSVPVIVYLSTPRLLKVVQGSSSKSPPPGHLNFKEGEFHNDQMPLLLPMLVNVSVVV
jgi:hypothetical protein